MIAMADIGLAMFSKAAKSSALDYVSLVANTPFASYINKTLVPLMTRTRK